MDLILLAILYTALFAISFQTVRNAGQAGPAGRHAGLPRRQKQTLFSLMLVLLCTVLNIYWMAHPAGATRPQLAGLHLFDVSGVLCALVAGTALRRAPTPRVVLTTGLALGGLCLSVAGVWGGLSLYGVRPEIGMFLESAGSAWGVSQASMGGIALFHYLLTPLMLAAALAGHDEYARLHTWERDRAFRWIALFSLVLSTAYLVFTWRVVRGA